MKYPPAPTIAAAAFFLLALPAAPARAADKLVTASFEVAIDVRCPEGVVGCNDVLYTGVSRKTGESITLKGRELHTLCADRVTPCRFLGYVFRRGKVTYTVWENGYLSVTEGSKVLVGEQGEWK